MGANVEQVLFIIAISYCTVRNKGSVSWWLTDDGPMMDTPRKSVLRRVDCQFRLHLHILFSTRNLVSNKSFGLPVLSTVEQLRVFQFKQIPASVCRLLQKLEVGLKIFHSRLSSSLSHFFPQLLSLQCFETHLSSVFQRQNLPSVHFS